MKIRNRFANLLFNGLLGIIGTFILITAFGFIGIAIAGLFWYFFIRIQVMNFRSR